MFINVCRHRLPPFTPFTPSRLFTYGKWVSGNEKYDDDGGLTVFGSYAKSYDRCRPFYPPGLWTDAICTENSPVRRAVDVCAGTGRGAKALKRLGVEDVMAVDLDRGMLAEIGEGINTVWASAESMPIKDGDVDLVTCLQAFHWLDAVKTLDEFDRILKPNGRVVIAWNDRDLDDNFVDSWETLVERYNPKYSRDLKVAETYLPLMEHGAFSLTRRNYANEQILTANEFVEQMFTFSYVKNVLGESELVEIERHVREMVFSHFGVKGDEGTFMMKWTTKAFFLDKEGR